MHWIGHAAYLAAIAVIILTAAFLYRATAWVQGHTQRVDHAVEVLATLGEMGEAMSRTNVSQLSFLLSLDPAFIERRDRSILEARNRLAQLQRLTLDDSTQQARVAALERLAGQRIAEMLEAERVRRNDPPIRWADPGHAASSAAIVALFGELRQSGRASLAALRAEQEAEIRDVLFRLGAALFACIALLVPGYFAYSRHARARIGAERRLLDLAESLPGAVFQYRSLPDGTGRYEFLSHGVASLRGVAPAAGLADPELIFGTILPDDRKGLLEVIAAAEISGKDIEHDYRVNTKDGQVRWMRTHAAPRREEDGSVLWSGHWNDVTQKHVLGRLLEESKETAEAANRAKTTFLTTMSHEIRTPMNGVLGMLELLGRTQLSPEQTTMLQVIDDSGRGLLRIIDDILDFSKIEAGKLDLHPEPTSIAHVVGGVFAIYAGVADEKGLQLIRTLDPRISPAVMIDSLRLRQVLGNLVSNAIKFTPQGRVEIAAELIDRSNGSDLIRFSVKDTGIGISEEIQKQLFRPFFQAGAGTAHRFGGTGLGLVISEHLTTMMGGAIGVTSEPGVGTTMMVSIPAVIADPKSLPRATSLAHAGCETRPAPSVAAAEREGTLVLLADDHPTNRLILLRQLQLLGYAAEAAPDGFYALDMWRSGRFGLLLTDCEMPEMDGYELTRHIRAAELLAGGARIPILACTAYAVQGQAEKCLAAGMDDYLAKPVDLRRLGEKLAHWLPLSSGVEPGRSPEPGDAALPIDSSVLDEVCAGDAAMEREFLARFGACNEEDALLLARAIADPRWPEVASISHRMKGASRIVGATPFAEACSAIEKAARAADAGAVTAGMVPLGAELARLNEYLRARYAA
ncbi:MAG: ATP-binding protein [Usitatibacter sp.]